MSEKIFGGIFKDRTVLVTGHTGFMGSWLTLWLNHLGANVMGYSLKPPTEPSLFESLKLNDSMNSMIADIREREILIDACKKNKPDIIFHLAAQSLVRQSYDEPAITFETNVLGTVNILEAIRKNNDTKVAIIMTSDKCYDNKIDNKPHVETDPMGGFDPYSASKGSAELVTSSYRNSYFIEQNSGKKPKIATIRAGNVIGGGDWAIDRIIPDTIKSIVKNENILLRNPNSVRPWQYVLEPISGMLWLAAKIFLGEKSLDQAWNLGPDNSEEFFSVKELVQIILEKWHSNSKLEIIRNPNEPFESKSLLVNPSKANKILEWKNVYSVVEALEETVLWYKNFYTNPKDIGRESISQIEKYVSKAAENKLIWSKEGK